VYRFLFTRRWLGLAALAVVLAVIMVGLGNWQLDRYHQKVAINDRIDAAARAAPGGDVSIVGAVRLPERSVGRVETLDGRLQVRRIAPIQLARALPYPVLGGYVTITQDGLKPVPVEYEGTLQNGGYALQWWAFAAMTLVGYGYLARRQARESVTPERETVAT